MTIFKYFIFFLKKSQMLPENFELSSKMLFSRGKKLKLYPAKLMGILNCTLDSFSDGSRFFNFDAALNQARKMIDNGADSIMIFPPFSWALSYDEDLIFNHHNIIAKTIKSPIMIYQASINAGSMAYKPNTLERLINISEVIAIKEGSWETSKYDFNRRLDSLKAEMSGVKDAIMSLQLTTKITNRDLNVILTPNKT